MKLLKRKKKTWGPGDYWHLGPVYIRKRLLLAALGAGSVLILGILGLPSGLTFSLPSAPPVYRWDDPALQSVSGVVQITDSAGQVRYVGQVQQGACTGTGKVYDSAGQLCYDGPLVNGIYEGADAKVYTGGVLVYTGEMFHNLYEGLGRRTDPDTGAVSTGQFSRGMLEGQGSVYSAGGVLLQEGTFSQDLLHGTGKVYTPDGIVLYAGQFERGLYQGSGKLYDPLTQALLYEGEFAAGRATGAGKIYHPSGQLLYEGQVWDARPRADAFISLSLEEVEQAFAQHWQAYVWEGVTAFVYPYFQLMLVTESPVAFVSSGAVPEQASLEAADTASGPEILSPETDKTSILITQVLSYGQALPGVPQPEENSQLSKHQTAWREWFSDYALGIPPAGAQVAQTGPFVCRFTREESARTTETASAAASGATLETQTAWKTDKDGSLWYQTAKWRQDP